MYEYQIFEGKLGRSDICVNCGTIVSGSDYSKFHNSVVTDVMIHHNGKSEQCPLLTSWQKSFFFILLETSLSLVCIIDTYLVWLNDMISSCGQIFKYSFEDIYNRKTAYHIFHSPLQLAQADRPLSIGEFRHRRGIFINLGRGPDKIFAE